MKVLLLPSLVVLLFAAMALISGEFLSYLALVLGVVAWLLTYLSR
jgi:hypothetical protein